MFVSCGQKRDSDERIIADRVAAVLKQMGFDPYVAFVEQTLNGLKENIFAHLDGSEYFLFIDYKRDLLKDRADSRGSLFSNQELAIASYLGISALVLQEQGIVPLDGMMGVFQANAYTFTARSELPDFVGKLVQEKIDKKEWSPIWKNKLLLEIQGEPSTARSRDIHGNPAAYAFYHLGVKNCHFKKTALNCCVFLESAFDVETEKCLPFRTVEFKWAGTTLPAVMIAPNTIRLFDAFKKPLSVMIGGVAVAGPFKENALLEVVEFSTFSDSTEFMPRITKAGIYDLTYGIYSSNFSLCRSTVRIENGSKPADVNLTIRSCV